MKAEHLVQELIEMLEDKSQVSSPLIDKFLKGTFCEKNFDVIILEFLLSF